MCSYPECAGTKSKSLFCVFEVNNIANVYTNTTYKVSDFYNISYPKNNCCNGCNWNLSLFTKNNIRVYQIIKETQHATEASNYEFFIDPTKLGFTSGEYFIRMIVKNDYDGNCNDSIGIHDTGIFTLSSPVMIKQNINTLKIPLNEKFIIKQVKNGKILSKKIFISNNSKNQVIKFKYFKNSKIIIKYKKLIYMYKLNIKH